MHLFKSTGSCGYNILGPALKTYLLDLTIYVISGWNIQPAFSFKHPHRCLLNLVGLLKNRGRTPLLIDLNFSDKRTETATGQRKLGPIEIGGGNCFVNIACIKFRQVWFSLYTSIQTCLFACQPGKASFTACLPKDLFSVVDLSKTWEPHRRIEALSLLNCLTCLSLFETGQTHLGEFMNVYDNL